MAASPCPQQATTQAIQALSFARLAIAEERTEQHQTANDLKRTLQSQHDQSEHLIHKLQLEIRSHAQHRSQSAKHLSMSEQKRSNLMKLLDNSLKQHKIQMQRRETIWQDRLKEVEASCAAKISSDAKEKAELIDRVSKLEDQLVCEKYRGDALDEVTKDLLSKQSASESQREQPAACSTCSKFKQKEELDSQRFGNLQRKLDERTRRIQELERSLDEIDRLKAVNSRLEEAIDVSAKRLTQAHQRCDDKQARLESIKSDRERDRAQLERTEMQCQTLADQLEDVKAQLQKCNASCKHMRAQHEEMRRKADIDQEARQDLLEQVRKFEQSQEDALSLISAAKASSIENEARAAMLAQDNERVKQEVERLRDVVKHLEHDLSVMNGKVANLVEQKADLERELAASRAAHESALKDHENALESISSLSEDLHQFKAQNSHQSEQLGRMVIDLEQAKSTAVAAQLQHVEDAQTIESLNSNCKSLCSRLERSEQIKMQLQMGIAEDISAEGQRENASPSNAAPASKSQDQEAAIDRAKRMAQKLSKQLAASKRQLKEAQKETDRYRLALEKHKQLLQMQKTEADPQS